ncbi:hypothetical protein [Devosia sediminis]|uniref:Uncharacterized protein n=1 Tax=Devosia sediminis TaxID=2798801 RepID=A0A934MIQ7_9HYPH|nr:hypothetical protein [Devosia sediminis]MBJ3783213.1 hypothetical protein [Devosia sediminis]
MLPTLARLLPLAALFATPAFAQVSLKSIGDTCLETALDECKVLTAGYFNRADYSDAEGQPLIAWQTQAGSTPDDGVIGGFVLFRHDGEGWTLLDSGFEGFYQVPVFNEDNVLHVPGYSQGTGVFNTDRLYRLEEDGTTWTSINMGTWLDGVELPEGKEIWKGVQFDFSNPWSGYVARTSLWQGDDGNCCPSGGSAVISLEIQGDKLVGKEAEYTPPAEE